MTFIDKNIKIGGKKRWQFRPQEDPGQEDSISNSTPPGFQSQENSLVTIWKSSLTEKMSDEF